MNYLIQHGKISMEVLNDCLKTKTRHKINDIMIAVNGTLSIEQQNFLKMLLSHLDMLYEHLKEIENVIKTEVNQFSSAMQLITRIPGLAETAAASIIAEIGTDMSKFKTAEHICSWAGLSPGNNESAGKKNELP